MAGDVLCETPEYTTPRVSVDEVREATRYGVCVTSSVKTMTLVPPVKTEVWSAVVGTVIEPCETWNVPAMVEPLMVVTRDAEAPLIGVGLGGEPPVPAG